MHGCEKAYDEGQGQWQTDEDVAEPAVVVPLTMQAKRGPPKRVSCSSTHALIHTFETCSENDSTLPYLLCITVHVKVFILFLKYNLTVLKIHVN